MKSCLNLNKNYLFSFSCPFNKVQIQIQQLVLCLLLFSSCRLKLVDLGNNQISDFKYVLISDALYQFYHPLQFSSSICFSKLVQMSSFRFLEVLSKIRVENLNLKGNEVCSLQNYRQKVSCSILKHLFVNTNLVESFN